MFKIALKEKATAIIFLLATATIVPNAQAQRQSPSALDQNISISIYNEPAKGMLDLISRQSNVIFSYSPKVIDNRPNITLEANHQPIRLVMFTAFGETMRMKERGRYIILIDNRTKLGQPFGDAPQVVEGYITNPKTGERVSNATIYDKDLLVSATTDENGYFKVKVPYGERTAKLKVRKTGYADTTIVPISPSTTFVNLNLPSIAIPQATEAPHRRGLLGITFPKWLLSEDLWTNSVNIGDTIYRSWQFSVLPYVGTNHHLSGNVVNAFSVNMIGGYSQGVSVMEIGAVTNIVRRDARYFMSSCANYVGGHMLGVQTAAIFNRTQSVTGVQFAGVLNQSFGLVRGAQLAGVASITKGALRGLQISGMYSHNANNSGVQVSGIASVSQQIRGAQASGMVSYGKGQIEAVQMSGIASILRGRVIGLQSAGVACIADTVIGAQLSSTVAQSGGEIVGLQVAGVAAIAKNVSGAQLSALTSIASTVKGAQLGGVASFADTVKGVQISTIVNRAKVLKGVQFGLINIADSCSGTPIGLVNIIKKGYHPFEISIEEFFNANVAYYIGSKRLHTILSVGSHIDPKEKLLWGYGLGFGTILPLTHKLNIDIQVHSKKIIQTDKFSEENDYFQLYTSIGRSCSARRGISVGLTANLVRYNSSQLSGRTIEKAIPYSILEKTGKDGKSIRGWIGGRVAFFF